MRPFLTDGFAASGSSAGVHVASARVADGLLAGIRAADGFAADGFAADGFAVGAFSADAFPAGYLLNMSCAGLQPSGIVCLACITWPRFPGAKVRFLWVSLFCWRVQLARSRAAKAEGCALMSFVTGRCFSAMRSQGGCSQ